jgi:hypothetical protein
MENCRGLILRETSSCLYISLSTLTISGIKISAQVRCMPYLKGFPWYSPAFPTPGADMTAWRNANTLERVNPKSSSIFLLLPRVKAVVTGV